MRFLVDECTGPTVAAWLRDNGHVVFSVFEESRGMDDDDIIQMAYEEKMMKAPFTTPGMWNLFPLPFFMVMSVSLQMI